MTFKPALLQTLAAHRPTILYTTSAVTWAAAATAAYEDVDTDAMLILAVAALASALIAFQHTALARHRQATERLTRTILSRPHDRDHEVTGPFAPVSALRERRERRENLG